MYISSIFVIAALVSQLTTAQDFDDAPFEKRYQFDSLAGMLPMMFELFTIFIHAMISGTVNDSLG